MSKSDLPPAENVVEVRDELPKRGRPSFRGIRTFASLKSSAYRFYFFGMAGQWASMNMQMVARSMLIYRLTGSGAILGLMSLANAIPTLLLSLFGGALADRINKKAVIQIGQIASALNAFTIAITLTTGYLSAGNPGSWWILIVNSVLQGTIMALMMPSRQAMIPEVVKPDQVMNAVALNSLGMNTLRLVAPAVAGFLIDLFNFQAVFYAMTGLYMMAVALTSFLPNKGSGKKVAWSSTATIGDIALGLKYIWRDRTVFAVLIAILVAIVLSMPYQMMMPIFADDVLKVGASGMGILMSVSGAGAIAGSLIVATLPNKRRGVLLITSSLLLGLALAAFAFSKSMPLSVFFMIFVGLGQAGRQTLGSTLLQSYTEEGYLGRVMSVNMMDMGLSSLGTFFAGVLSDTIGVAWAIGGMGLLLALASLLSLAFFTRIRRLQ